MMQPLLYREGEIRVIEGLWIFVSQRKQDRSFNNVRKHQITM